MEKTSHRAIALDTETTGFKFQEGHRIIEIGCVEMINRKPTGNTYHVYINPEREVPEDAVRIHGIRTEDLVDKPVFAEIAQEFIDFVRGAELIIHNAAFDQPFLDAELQALDQNFPLLGDICEITDTLKIARKKRPGKRNNLDALCRDYGIDNSHRTLHGALLDAEILIDVYLLMTGGQRELLADVSTGVSSQGVGASVTSRIERSLSSTLPLIEISESDKQSHQNMLALLSNPIWK